MDQLEDVVWTDGYVVDEYHNGIFCIVCRVLDEGCESKVAQCGEGGEPVVS